MEFDGTFNEEFMEFDGMNEECFIEFEFPSH